MGVYRKASLSRFARPGRLPGGGDTCDEPSKAQIGNDRLRHVHLDMPLKNTGQGMNYR